MHPSSEISSASWVQALARAIDAGVLLLSSDRRVEYASPAALELLGCATLEQLEQRWPVLRTELLPPTVDWQHFPAEPDSGEPDVVLLRDPGQAHLRERERRLAAQYLIWSRLQRATEHELRDPWNAIALHLELLEQGGGPALEIVRREFGRFSTRLQDFLRRSRAVEDACSTFDLRELLLEVQACLAALAKERRVRVHVVAPDPGLPMTGYRGRLQQALLLVALDGIEAMPEGGELVLRTESGHGSIRILVADTGPPETRPDASSLGLPVARAILAAHGGQLELERSGPRGTTMRLELPARTGAA